MTKKKGKKQDDNQYWLFDIGDNSIPRESYPGVKRRNNPRKTATTTAQEERDYDTRTSEGIVTAFTRQTSFSGVVYFTTIFLDANSKLWPKLSKERKGGKKAHKEGT